MPNLPTLQVTAAQQTRIGAALGDTGDGVAYKAWLREQLKNAVINYEAETIRRQARLDEDAKRSEISASLDTAV